jgi:NTE family protein
MTKRIGVALGGGGVRGLAHVLALETIDAAGIRPAAVAGTSMGAVVGALYAAGHSGAAIKAGIRRHLVSRNDGLKEVLAKRSDLLKWLRLVSIETRRGGLLRPDGFLAYLFDEIGVTTFEALNLPLRVVATDFWTGEQVVFDSGDLLTAVKASMAIPGVFAPVVKDGRVLVDGGVVNNVPYDTLADLCEWTIAVDVSPMRRPRDQELPNAVDALVGMFDIPADRVTALKMAANPPSLYLRPPIERVQPLEFDKIERVFAQAAPCMAAFRADLGRLVGEP